MSCYGRCQELAQQQAVINQKRPADDDAAQPACKKHMTGVQGVRSDVSCKV
jgi:hypothetical protein